MISNNSVASSSQLTTILDAFNHGINQLITDAVQPKFLEKAVIETFQNIRDDMTYILASRSSTLLKAWDLVNILFKRYQNYKAYYVQNYDFLNFGFSDLNRQKIVITTKAYEIEITWSSYANNGYIYVMTLAPEQFGIISAKYLTDLIWIKVVKDDGIVKNKQQKQIPSVPTDVPLQIKYTWTNSIQLDPVSYQIFDKEFPAYYAPSAGTAVSTIPITCNYATTSPTFCPAFAYPPAAVDKLLIFHHGTILNCPGITSANLPYYRLAYC